MVKEQVTESPSGSAWAQDQLYQLRAQAAQLEQQLGHLQAAFAQLTETMHAMERTLRDASQGAAQAPRLQEEVNHTVALVVHLQDQAAELKERVDSLSRNRAAEEGREHEDWIDLARRTEQLERQVATWQDRQAGVDEVGRRFQEGLSLVRQELQQIDQRLEAVETKAARGLEGANRAEHTITQVEAAILKLQHDDEAIAERTRAAAETARRLEATLGEHVQQLQRVELLAERIELHRAERQRLEDRALRLEEALNELRGRAEREDQARGRLNAQQQGLASRLDALQEQLTEQRAKLVDQIRRLTASQERTKRRQVQELERELREMRKYVADLADQQ